MIHYNFYSISFHQRKRNWMWCWVVSLRNCIPIDKCHLVQFVTLSALLRLYSRAITIFFDSTSTSTEFLLLSLFIISNSDKYSILVLTNYSSIFRFPILCIFSRRLVSPLSSLHCHSFLAPILKCLFGFCFVIYIFDFIWQCLNHRHFYPLGR